MSFPKRGYEFGKTVRLKVNDIWYQLSNADPDSIRFEQIFNFQEEISGIEITGLTEPAAGIVPSVDGLLLSDENCSIASAVWYDADTNDVVSTIFEAGHTYCLEIMLAAKDGYFFSDELSVCVNGEDAEVYHYDSSRVVILKRFSLKEVIPEIRIDHTLEMVVGSAPAYDVTLPADAKYTCDVFWSVWNDRTGRYEENSNSAVFESGKLYRLEFSVTAAQGYRFDENTTRFLVSGTETANRSIIDSHAVCWKEFSSDLLIIDRIELQVNAPTAGQHTSLTPVITIPSGVSYRLGEMPIWIQGDLDRHTPVMEEFFTDADNYGVRMQAFANEGYRFAENLSVIVNGVTLSAESLSSAQKGTDILFFFSDANSGNTGSEAPGSSSQPEGSDSDDQSQSTASGSGDQSQDTASGSESTALDSVQSQIPVLPKNNMAAVQTLPEKDASSSSGVLKKDTDVTSKENTSGLWWIWLIIIVTAVLIFAVGVWYKKKRL